MEGERHTHPLCLGETNSVDHSLICKLGSYFNEARLSERDWGTDKERGLQGCSDWTHTSANQWKWLWKKSTLLTMQGWISLRENCGIAVKKLLWHTDHTSYLTVLFWEVPSRDLPTKNMKKRRVSTTKKWLTLRSLHSTSSLSSQQVEGWQQTKEGQKK